MRGRKHAADKEQYITLKFEEEKTGGSNYALWILMEPGDKLRRRDQDKSSHSVSDCQLFHEKNLLLIDKSYSPVKIIIMSLGTFVGRVCSHRPATRSSKQANRLGRNHLRTEPLD